METKSNSAEVYLLIASLTLALLFWGKNDKELFKGFNKTVEQQTSEWTEPLTRLDSIVFAVLDPDLDVQELYPNWIKEVRSSDTYHVVTVTVYNPVEEQCDSDPTITADGSKIDLHRLSKGELKWCAVSRDLLKKYPYGTIIELDLGNGPEKYEVHDTMNERFRSYVDILQPVSVTRGKWNKVLTQRI